MKFKIKEETRKKERQGFIEIETYEIEPADKEAEEKIKKDKQLNEIEPANKEAEEKIKKDKEQLKLNN